MTACPGDLFAQCGGAIAGASVMLGLLGEADPGQQTHEVGAGRHQTVLDTVQCYLHNNLSRLDPIKWLDSVSSTRIQFLFRPFMHVTFFIAA